MFTHKLGYTSLLYFKTVCFCLKVTQTPNYCPSCSTQHWTDATLSLSHSVVWLSSLTYPDVSDINNYGHCHTEASWLLLPNWCDPLNQRWFSCCQSQQQLRQHLRPGIWRLQKNSQPHNNTRLCWDQADAAGCALWCVYNFSDVEQRTRPSKCYLSVQLVVLYSY